METAEGAGKLKLAFAVNRGPTSVREMTRDSFDSGASLLHVAAVALNCTSEEAKEQVIALKGFTGLDETGRVLLKLDDLTSETVKSCRDDGIRAVKFFLQPLCQQHDGGSPLPQFLQTDHSIVVQARRAAQ